MSEKAFTKLMRGLEEAKAYMKGEYYRSNR